MTMMNDVMESASKWWADYVNSHDVSTVSDVVASLLSDLRSRDTDDDWESYAYLYRYESVFKDPAIRMYVQMLLQHKKVGGR